jgi:hypothetical protein
LTLFRIVHEQVGRLFVAADATGIPWRASLRLTIFGLLGQYVLSGVADAGVAKHVADIVLTEMRPLQAVEELCTDLQSVFEVMLNPIIDGLEVEGVEIEIEIFRKITINFDKSFP